MFELREQSRRYPIADPYLAVVRDRLASEQPDQVRLARAVRADQSDPLAEVDLVLERAHEAVDPDVAQRHDDSGRVRAADADLDLLIDDGSRRRPGVDEAAPARLRGVGALAEHVGDGRPLLHRLIEMEQPPLLALPLLQPISEQFLALLPRLGVGPVRPAVRPRPPGLKREDRGRGRAEQLAVVADQHDRLVGGGDPRLQLELRRNIEEVVWLVEQQHRGVALKQHVEHEPLTLAAREVGGGARTDVIQRGANNPPTGRVPTALELIATELGPVADRIAQAHARPGWVCAGGQLALGREHPPARVAQSRRRSAQQQLANRAAVSSEADVLRHVGKRADVDVALVGGQLAREHTEQRRLTDAVRTDEPHMRRRRDLE